MSDKITQTSALKNRFGTPLAFYGDISLRLNTEK